LLFVRILKCSLATVVFCVGFAIQLLDSLKRASFATTDGLTRQKKNKNTKTSEKKKEKTNFMRARFEVTFVSAMRFVRHACDMQCVF